jgi:hypothetical protein
LIYLKGDGKTSIKRQKNMIISVHAREDSTYDVEDAVEELIILVNKEEQLMCGV